MTKQELIDHLQHLEQYTHYSEDAPALREAIEMLKCSEMPNGSDTISRQAAIDALHMHLMYRMGTDSNKKRLDEWINNLPSAQPEQRYTEEELRVFAHGISLSLLSKRSAQHWRYDEDTATEIKFLERLYEKVGADMRGEQE